MGRREEAKKLTEMKRAWDNRSIITPPANEKYREGWEKCFGKKDKKEQKR